MKKALSACVAVTSVTLLDSPDDQIAAIEQAFASLDPILARYDEISMADADGKRIKVRDNRYNKHRRNFPQASTNPRSTQGRKAQAEDYSTLTFCKSLSLLAAQACRVTNSLTIYSSVPPQA